MTTTIPTSQLGAIDAQATARARAEQAQLRGPSRSFWQDAWQRFRRDRLAVLGGVIFFALCLLSASAPLISEYVTGYDPNRINLRDEYAYPSARHWFGADENGRDYFTRIVYAGRVSLSIGLLFAAVSLIIGVSLGLAAGYYGGVFDDLVQGLINILNSIPFLPLLIIVGSLLQGYRQRLDWPQVALILAILGWTGACRQVRGLVLSVKERDYVLAARTVGAQDGRILAQHLLPNVFSIVLVILGFDIAGAILTESALSFLGFGVSPPTATWGNMLSNSLQYSSKNPWLVFFPGLFISLTVLSVYLLADGLRDAMDPKLRR